MSSPYALFIKNANKYLLDAIAEYGLEAICITDSKSQHPSNIKTITLNDIQNQQELESCLHTLRRKIDIAYVLPAWEGSVKESAIAAKILNLPSNSLDAILNSRDKYRTYSLLSKFNIPVAKTFKVYGVDDIIKLINHRDISFPFILKLPSSTNSQSVTLITDTERLTSEVVRLKSLYEPSHDNRLRDLYNHQDQSILVQEYVKGDELGLDFVYHHKQCACIGIFQKAPMNGPYFGEMYSHYPTLLSDEVLQQCVNISEKSLRAIGATIGAAHIELRHSDSGPKIIEIALRPGGFYTPYAIAMLTGKRSYAHLLDCLSEKDLSVNHTTTKCCLFGAVNFDRSGIIQKVDGEAYLFDNEYVIEYEMLKKVGDTVKALPEGTDYHVLKYFMVGNQLNPLLWHAKELQNKVTIHI